MTRDSTLTAVREISHVCVVGAGTMGRGIAQVALQAGHTVSLVDPDQRQLAAAAADIRSRLSGRYPDLAAHLDSLLVTVSTIAETNVLGRTLVIEAVLEDLAVKQSVFAEALAHFGDDCILATNTSSLSVTEIAAGSGAPARVVGMHFFNPVPVMKLVEVVRGLDTPADLADEIARLAVSWGKEVAHVRSAPGFIVNRVARPFYGEALRLLEEGTASHEVIDTVIRGAGQFRMGPFELMDLIGNDVNYKVTRTVWSAFNYDPRFAPSQIQSELVAGRRFGRKTGRGFYEYDEGTAGSRRTRTATAVDAAGSPEPQIRVAVSLPALKLLGSSEQLGALLARSGATVAQVGSNGRAHLEVAGLGAVVVTRGVSAAVESAELGMPVVVLDRCADPAEVATLAVAATDDDLLQAVVRWLASAGVALFRVTDTPGLIVARVVSMIINEAWETAHLGVAGPEDIDTAMKLGTNYPMGPFEWCRRWGATQVLDLLDALGTEYRDARYRASQSLRAHARDRQGGAVAPA